MRPPEEGTMPLSFGARNIGELAIEHSVDVDPRTGAASLRVPVPAPPGRNGLSPDLVLTYTSGAGSSAFGAGWSLGGLPAIGLDTRLRVPRWDGSDGYQLGGEELVPWLELADGAWKPRGFASGDWSVAFLRPRHGRAALRVEKWVHVPTGRIHFRTRDAGDRVTLYGARPSAAARIEDPADQARTLAWLPELLLDPDGNALWIEYAAETADGVDRSAPFERRRPCLTQRYPKRISYGNTAPLSPGDGLIAGEVPAGTRWCFQIVFDYGDHGPDAGAQVAPDRAWPARPDPFSTFRNGFEVRTHRLCRRLLAFHDFDALGPGPTLVGALTLAHDEHPAGSTLREIGYTGYRRDGEEVSSKKIPPLRMTYAPAGIGDSLAEVSVQARENVPAGLTSQRQTFIDLFGDGLPGILTESDRAWYYKPNLGHGELGPQTTVLERPATRAGTFRLGDIDQDGDTDVSQLAGRLAGLYELDREQGVWRGFRPFAALPHVEGIGGHARWVDLNGDGRPDIVITRPDAFVWFPSAGEGFEESVEIPRPRGAEAIPTLAADPRNDLFFADMTGDGLSDLVRVQNGCVEYWPSLGNGCFGERVVMDGAPDFGPDGDFDASRLRFVDLDGSGTTDLLYLGHGEVLTFLNACGNRLLPGPRRGGLPYFDNLSSVRVLDFLGEGRSCLLWSSPLQRAAAPMEYLPLSPAIRSRSLLTVNDSLGHETRLFYSSSATHYLRDVASGRGWSTRLPVHHPVVDRREVVDLIGNTRSVQRFEYHDGYYDGAEREHRGFAQVDVHDGDPESGASPDEGEAGFAAPLLTRTWFHLGTCMWDHQRPHSTYAGDPSLPWLAPHVIEDAGGMSEGELEAGLRALAGQVLRREIHATDAPGGLHPHPYQVEQHSYLLRRAQPAAGSAKAAFSVTNVEDATWVYEQAAEDPRVSHHVVIETDEFGSVVREASMGYARRGGVPRDVAAQSRHLVSVQDHRFANIDEPDRFEIGVPIEGKSYELVGLLPGPEGLFTPAQLRSPDVALALSAPVPHHIDPTLLPPLGDEVPTLWPPLGDEVPTLCARLLSWEQSFYWNDAREGALPLGGLGAQVMVHHEEAACFTPDFIADVLGGRVDGAELALRGYVAREGLWWQVDETHHFTPAAQFSLRAATERRDGALTQYVYDAFCLEVVQITDPLGNTTVGVIDYHMLAPWRLTDPNGNVSEVRYDPLGVVVAATSYGHVGDGAWGFEPLDPGGLAGPATFDEILRDPSSFLGGAARRVHYELDAWSVSGSPTRVLTLTREQLLHDGAGGDGAGGRYTNRILLGVAYLDGLGRPLQEKVLVEDGPAIQRDARGRVIVDAGGRPVLGPASPRWRSSGHVAYDNKQRPGRHYEPFFSPSPAYEGEEVLRHVGAPTTTRYDAMGRVVGQDFPDGTFTETTFRAWSVERADPNDTVLASAYRALREGLPADHPERQAYEHAKTHAGTTTITYLDPLGRETASLAKGGATAPDRFIETRLDIEGQAREIKDPRGLVAFSYRRDMQGRLLFEQSADAGATWSFPDALDRVVRTWDSRGFEIERGHDLGDRPTHTMVRGGDGPSPMDHRVEEWEYGESLPDPVDAARRNLLGRLVRARDSAGEVSADRYDPAGSALSSTRRLRATVDREPDYRAPEPLEAESFTTSAAYDALGRPRTDTLPDGTVRRYEYLRSGPLERVRLSTPDGKLVDAPILDGATHGARGERRGQTLGNGIRIDYGYSPDTQRLATQTASRGPRLLQGLQYTYDPAGNLVRITDSAQEGPSAVVRGAAVSARRDQVYDAHYRLRRATGRVHQALLAYDDLPGQKGTIKSTRHITLDNGAAIERYSRTYDHDASGNLLQIQHKGKSQSWTTEFWISPTSNRSVPALDPNGLPVQGPEGKFDGGGNLRSMPHLRRMEWSHRATLQRCVVIERPGGVDDDERYVYGGDGLRVRKITTRLVQGGQIEITEKLTLGDSERKRIRRGGAIVFERWTTHVSDGAQRIALLHRWIQDDLGREVDVAGTARIHYQLGTHQGSSALELNEAGEIVSYEEYFPHGGTAFLAGDDAREVARKEYRYCGKERDDFTGLYDYGHRYYAPWMGRWLSPDPIGPADSLNLYEFVRGDPVGNVDEDGLQTAGGGRQGGRIGHSYVAVAPLDAPRVELQPGQIQIKHPGTGKWEVVSMPEAVAIAEEYRTNLNIQEVDPKRAWETALKQQTDAFSRPLADAMGEAPTGSSVWNAAGGGGGAGGSGVDSHASGDGGSWGVSVGKGASPGKGSPGVHDGTGAGGAGGNGGGPAASAGKGAGQGGGTGNGIGDGSGPSLAGNGHGAGTGAGQGTGAGSGAGQGAGDRTGSGRGVGPGTGSGLGGGHGTGKDPGTGHGTKGTGEGNGTGTLDGGTGQGSDGTGRRTTDDSGAGDSGTGTPTGGFTAPALGDPPRNGDAKTSGDPAGAPDGSRDGVLGGAGKKPSSDEPTEGIVEGVPGGKPTGHAGGTADGSANPARDTAMDAATRAAGYANLEFEPGKKNGQSGGIPGGYGSVNLGATGQSLYLLATAIGFIGPGKIVKALKSGLKSLFKLGVRGILREGLLAGRGLWRGLFPKPGARILLDNNILHWISNGETMALEFAARYRGRMVINKTVVREFLANGRTAAQLREIARSHGMSIIPAATRGETQALLRQMGVNAINKDRIIIATAYQNGLRLATGDAKAIVAATRLGVDVRAWRLIGDGSAATWYNKLVQSLAKNGVSNPSSIIGPMNPWL